MKWSCSVFAAALLVVVAVGAVGGAAAGAAEEDPIDQTTSDPIDIGSTVRQRNKEYPHPSLSLGDKGKHHRHPPPEQG